MAQKTQVQNNNLQAIKKYHPELVGSLKKEFQDCPSELVVEPTKSGPPTFSLLTKDQRWICYHSRYNPVEEAKKIVNSWSLKKQHSEIVLLGLGFGYIPIAVIDKLAPHQKLWIVEPSLQVFQTAVKNVDFTPLLKRTNTHFAVGSDFFKKLRENFHKTDFKIFYFAYPPALTIYPELKEAVSYLEEITLSGLRRAMEYPKFSSSLPRVLCFEGGFHIEKEFQNCLHQQKIPCQTLSAQMGGVGGADFIPRLMEQLATFKPDFIFSVNQIGFDREGKLAEILSFYEIPFVSWFVDNPLPILARSGKNASEFGVCLLWDKSYVEPLQKLGFKKVKYFPYAADSSIFFPKPTKGEKRFPLSFVGSSMESTIQGRLNELKEHSYLLKIYEKLTDLAYSSERKRVETMALIKDELGGRKFSAPALSSLEVAIHSRWSQEKRVQTLLALEEFRPHIFGDNGWKKLLPETFNFHSPVNYRKELPDVYRSTEINLNISNVQLKSSVNQRLFDVCATGSFILTDGHKAVKEFLIPGETVETYQTLEELVQKTRYYLCHPKKREEIEKKGNGAILNNHTYVHRFQEMATLLKEYFG